MAAKGLVRELTRAICGIVLSTTAFSITPAAAAEKYVLMLDWLPSGDKAPAYVALQQGYFAAEGLDITIQNARGTSDALTKIATGVADFGTGGLPALMSAAAQSYVPVKAVFSIYTKPPDSLFVITGGPIKTLKDVVGKKVGTATFTSSNTLWPLVLQLNAIDPASISVSKVDPAVLGPMLALGQVDATISWVSVAPTYGTLLKQAGRELTVLPWSEFGLDGYGLSAFASDRVIKSNPEAVAGFVRALNKGIQFCLADPDAAGAAVHSAAAMVDPSIAAGSFRVSVPLIKNEITDRDGMGTFEPALLKKTWEWVAKSETYAIDKIDPASVVDTSFAPRK